MPLTYCQAIQAITALESRATDFEGRLAAGTCAADDAEFVIRDAIAAAQSLRHDFGIPGLATDRVDRSVLAFEAMPATSSRFWSSTPDPDYEQALERAAIYRGPRGGIDQYQAEDR